MRERWEKGSVIGKPRSLAHRVFPAGFRQRFPHLALRTEPDNRCVVCGSSVGRAEPKQSRKFESCPHIPENCNLWKFVHLLSKFRERHTARCRVPATESGAC